MTDRSQLITKGRGQNYQYHYIQLHEQNKLSNCLKIMQFYLIQFKFHQGLWNEVIYVFHLEKNYLPEFEENISSY